MSTFKRTKVVMLPTGYKVSKIGQLCTSIRHDKKPLIFGEFENSYLGECWRQHLYFLSDDEIKEGDWYYSTFNDHQPKIQQRKGEWRTCFNQYKIIATTDKLLGLAQPSQGFIQKYCEKGGIDEVMVEYEFRHDDSVPFPKTLDGYAVPKVSSDNTITIRAVKDSWSREEVEYLCRRALHTRFSGGMCFQEDADKWIKENL